MENGEKMNSIISKIWDNNCRTRALDIESGTDITYGKVILPYVINTVNKIVSKDERILDIGCGCGFLTNKIYQSGFENIKGIDISKESIYYCQKKYPYINFYNENLYNIEETNKYRCCISVMTMNNLPDIEGCFRVVHSLLQDGGVVIITIPHPCFWPQRHLNDTCFIYGKEASYEVNFSTKGRKDYSPILYFHRPLEMYFDAISRFGFKLVQISELNDKGAENPDVLGIVLIK